MRSFTTKGDNNDVADTHIISDGDIVGQYVFKIPGMGKVMDFLSSTWGFLIVIVLPMLLFFIYQVYHLVIVGMNLKRAMAEEDRMARAAAIVDGEGSDAEAGSDVERAEAARADAEVKLAEARRLKAEARRPWRQAARLAMMPVDAIARTTSSLARERWLRSARALCLAGAGTTNV